MNALLYAIAVLRESISTARSQKAASILSIIMVAGMCATILLTTGRTVAAEDSVLKTLDDSGTTSIFIRAQGDAGLDASVLGRIHGIEGISWVAAFGPAQDVTNVRVPGGVNVPLRLGYGADLESLGAAQKNPGANSAWASPLALRQLGMPDGVGGVVADSGETLAVVGRLHLPAFLGELEPAIIAPRSTGSNGPVSLVAIHVTRPALVAPVAKALRGVIGVSDPSKVTIATSANLAEIRSVIEGQLGDFGRSLIVVVFAITGILVAAILYGLVTLRRKDFGRRRALGATRGLIVGLLLSQMAILSILGSLLGIGAAMVPLLVEGSPLPDVGFVAAVGILAVCVSVLAAIIPAASAARRDPLRELRVP